jgi:hypothetical protein
MVRRSRVNIFFKKEFDYIYSLKISNVHFPFHIMHFIVLIQIRNICCVNSILINEINTY